MDRILNRNRLYYSAR